MNYNYTSSGYIPIGTGTTTTGNTNWSVTANVVMQRTPMKMRQRLSMAWRIIRHG